MTNKLGIPITDLPDFSKAALTRLAELWITRAEELVSAADQTGGRVALSTFLDLPVGEIDALVAIARAVLPADESFAEENIELALGAMPVADIAPPDDEPYSFAELAPAVDLRDKMPKIRNQGQRGTCVAHAAVAVREFLSGDISTNIDLSEQHLYWACKEQDNIQASGTFIKVAISVLKDLGVCPEQTWPYNPLQLANNEGQGPPPIGAATDAEPFKVTAYNELNARWIISLKKVLADGLPIAFSVSVFESWQRPYTYRVGDMRLPLPGEKQLGGHAMCMVGYVDDVDVPGGGYFLVRNSWGETFGYYGEVAPGYCRLPYEYVRQNGWEAFVVYVD